MIPLDNVQHPYGHVKHGVACHHTRNISNISCDIEVFKPVPSRGHDVVARCSKDVSGKGFECPTQDILHLTLVGASSNSRVTR